MNWEQMLTRQLCYCPLRGRFLSWFVFTLFLSTVAGFASGTRELSFSFDQRWVFKMGRESFSLATETGVEKLGRRAEELVTLDHDTPGENGKKPKNPISKRDTRGLKQIG